MGSIGTHQASKYQDLRHNTKNAISTATALAGTVIDIYRFVLSEGAVFVERTALIVGDGSDGDDG